MHIKSVKKAHYQPKEELYKPIYTRYYNLVFTRDKVIDRLVRIRKRAKFSAKNLSKSISQHEGYITKVENGYIFPPFDVMNRILHACGATFHEMFADNFEKYHEHQDMIRIFEKVSPQHQSAAVMLLMGLINTNNNAPDTNVDNK